MSKAAKKAISLPAEMYQDALKRLGAMGYTSFSEYIQFLIREDLRNRPAHVREEPDGKYNSRPSE